MQVWLLQDRLCFAPLPISGDTTSYIPLDRITVRPLPKGYRPNIGVALNDEPPVTLSGRHADHAAAKKTRASVFSVQYGLKTAYWAAANAQEAKASCCHLGSSIYIRQSS